MKKLLFTFIFLATLASSVFATPVTVSQITIPNWQAGGSTAELRVYSDKSFYASDGTFVPATRVDSRTAYITVTCTVSGTNVTCPQIAMQTTDDGSNRQDARFTVRLYTDTGKPTEVFLLINAVVPSTQAPTTTWTAIAAANSMATPTPTPTDAYTTSEADGIHGTITTLANTALTQANAAIDAIGLNIPDEATLASSNTTAASNPSTKYFYNVSGLVNISSNRTIPSNVVTKVSSGGKFIQTGSYTLTIQGALDSPPVHIFQGFATNEVKVMGGTHVYPQWWGAKGDGTTDDYLAIQSAIDARRTGSNDFGVKVVLPIGLYRTSAPLRISSLTHLTGTAGGGWSALGGGAITNTTLLVDAGVTGIIVQKITVAGALGDGDYSTIENLTIFAAGKSGSTADGIRMHGRTRLVNVYVNGFARNGVFFDTITDFFGNTNESSAYDVKAFNNGTPSGTLTASMANGSSTITSSNAVFKTDGTSFGTLVRIENGKQLTVTDATNAFPIVVTTSTKHNWGGQDLIHLSGIGGNTNANGSYGLTWIGDYKFSLLTYGNGAYTSGGTADGLAVTDATNSSPIYITTASAHGKITGDTVTVSGVGGNTAANGTWKVTVLNSTIYAIAPYGNGAYTPATGTIIGNLIGRINTVSSATEATLAVEAQYIGPTPLTCSNPSGVSNVDLRIMGHGFISGGTNSTNGSFNNLNAQDNIGSGIYEDGSYGTTYNTLHVSGNWYYQISSGMQSPYLNTVVFLNPYNESVGRYPNRLYSTGAWKLGAEDGNSWTDDSTGIISQRSFTKFLPGNYITLGLQNNQMNGIVVPPILTVLSGATEPFDSYVSTNNDAINAQAGGGVTGSFYRALFGYAGATGQSKAAGVYGWAFANSTNGEPFGGYFKATGAGLNNIGIYLDASGGTTNWSIYSQAGNTRLTGWVDNIASTAPAPSLAASVRTYMDDISNKWNASVNGAAYKQILLEGNSIGGTTPSTGAFTTLSSTGQATVKKLNRSGTVALTPDGTVAIDASLADVFTLTPAEAEAISISNMSIGQNVTLLVLTSGTTDYVLTFSTPSFRSQGTLSTGTVDAKYFVINFFCNGSVCVETSRTTAM